MICITIIISQILIKVAIKRLCTVRWSGRVSNFSNHRTTKKNSSYRDERNDAIHQQGSYRTTKFDMFMLGKKSRIIPDELPSTLRIPAIHQRRLIWFTHIFQNQVILWILFSVSNFTPSTLKRRLPVSLTIYSRIGFMWNQNLSHFDS